jgi:hypothetical protein
MLIWTLMHLAIQSTIFLEKIGGQKGWGETIANAVKY